MSVISTGIDLSTLPNVSTLAPGASEEEIGQTAQLDTGLGGANLLEQIAAFIGNKNTPETTTTTPISTSIPAVNSTPIFITIPTATNTSISSDKVFIYAAIGVLILSLVILVAK